MEIRKFIGRGIKMKRNLWTWLLLVGILTCAVSCFSSERRGETYTDRDLRKLVRITASLLRENHFRGGELDRKRIAEKLFDEYFKRLDPGKIFFTQTDLAVFRSQQKDLDRQRDRGDFQFAIDVFTLYRERQKQYRAFAEERLKRPFDFNGNEEFPTDVTKLPYPADFTALKRVWEQKLKNDVLYYRLFNRAIDERRDADAKKKVNGSDAAEREHDRKVEQAWKPRSPEDRLLQRLRDVSNDIAQKDRVEIIGIYLDTLAQLYGPHSNYMPPSLDED